MTLPDKPSTVKEPKKAWAAGFVYYFLKPVDLIDFLDALSKRCQGMAHAFRVQDVFIDFDIIK